MQRVPECTSQHRTEWPQHSPCLRSSQRQLPAQHSMCTSWESMLLIHFWDNICQMLGKDDMYSKYYLTAERLAYISAILAWISWNSPEISHQMKYFSQLIQSTNLFLCWIVSCHGHRQKQCHRLPEQKQKSASISKYWLVFAENLHQSNWSGCEN